MRYREDVDPLIAHYKLPCSPVRFSTSGELGVPLSRRSFIPLAFATWTLGFKSGVGLYSIPLAATIGVWSVASLPEISADCTPKAKTPQDALWSWLLARATARRLNKGQKTRLPYDKTTQYPAGFYPLFIRPDATLDGLDYTQIKLLSTTFFRWGTRCIWCFFMCPV